MLASLFETKPVTESERKSREIRVNKHIFTPAESVRPKWHSPPEGYTPKIRSCAQRSDWEQFVSICDGLDAATALATGDTFVLALRHYAASLNASAWDYLYAMQDAVCRLKLLHAELDNMLLPNGVNCYFRDAFNSHMLYVHPCSAGLPETDAPEDTLLLRYVMACIASALALRMHLYSGVSSVTMLQSQHIALFSLPCREDWATCPFMELAADCYNVIYLWERFRYERDYQPWSGMCEIFSRFVRDNGLYHTSVLNYLVHNARRIHATVQGLSEPEPVRREIGLPHRFWPSYTAIREVQPLPRQISSIVLSRASGAQLPAFCGRDQWDMAFCLVPESPKVCASLRKLYGFPAYDTLYPESSEVKAMLYPDSPGFGFLLAQKQNLVYAGMESLADWFSLPDPDNPDYVCHKFYYPLEAQ